MPTPSNQTSNSQTLPFFKSMQPAVYAGITFFTRGTRLKFGRRNAVHEYPFRDDVWVEDLGRSARRIAMVGFLLGDDIGNQLLALRSVCEAPLGGELVHPLLGRLTVALLDVETAEQLENGRVLEIVLTFVEQGARIYPGAVQGSGDTTVTAAAAANTAATTSSDTKMRPALISPAASAGLAGVINGYGNQATIAGFSASSLLRMVAVLPGALSQPIRSGTGILSGQVVVPGAPATVGALIGQAAAGRQAITSANDALVNAGAAATPLTVSTVSAAVLAVADAIRTAAATPGDAVLALQSLATYEPAAVDDGDAGIVEQAAAVLMRQAAVIALVRAAADYQPQTSADALYLRNLVLDQINAVIDEAGDDGDDAVYTAMRSLRWAITQQLDAEGAALPSLVTITLQDTIPALVLAQQLYKDPSRADEVALRAGAVHPAFLPNVFQVLSS